ncbi:hypothetical protein D3C76_1733140 [compost metagenome]
MVFFQRFIVFFRLIELDLQILILNPELVVACLEDDIEGDAACDHTEQEYGGQLQKPFEAF